MLDTRFVKNQIFYEYFPLKSNIFNQIICIGQLKTF